MLPPRWVRRLLLVPLMFGLAAFAVVTLPVTAFAALLLGLTTPRCRTRPLRVLAVVLGYLLAEVIALIALGGLWLIAGFGRSIGSPPNEHRHYQVVRHYLRWLYALVKRMLRVQVRVEGQTPEAYRDRPLIVFCRHAGPGNSLLIVHSLLDWYDREPRIVLKQTLQWDPAIDIALNRLPNRFIRSGPPGLPTANRPGRPPVERVIGELSRRLDGNDALVLFPEGGNFTVHRRGRAIQRLWRRGLIAEAKKAETMQNVLPPRPAGVLAVLQNAGPADVVWVGHTGTDHLLSVADVWAALATRIEILIRWWHVPSQDVPADPEEQIAWLYRWWKRIDEWIAANQFGQDPPATR